MGDDMNEHPRTEEESFALFERKSYGYAASTYSHPWGNLTFADTGSARLANIAGWLTALGTLEAGNMEKLAGLSNLKGLSRRLAADLDKQLTYQGSYGGTYAHVCEERVEEDGGDITVKLPRFKVTLSDDGTFGGFAVFWYRPITWEKLRQTARELDPPSYTGTEDGKELSEDESRDRWVIALDKARQKLGIRKELEESRTYYGSMAQRAIAEVEAAGGDRWAPENKYRCSSSYEMVHYGFAWNGGLLYRGPGGGAVFSVTLDPGAGTERFWSVHT